ncbi:MAG: T9SS type A sorting domain-containing protein [bacterium]
MVSRYFLFVVTFLLIFQNLFAQNAYIEIKFDVYTYPDTTWYHSHLICGLDMSATDGIDQKLGEWELPPMSPGGDVRFEIPSADEGESYKDIRDIDSSGYQNIQHRIWTVNNYESSQGYILLWELPENVSMNIRDVIDGQYLNENFSAGKCSIILPHYFSYVFLNVEYTYDTFMDVTPKSLLLPKTAGHADLIVQFSNSFPVRWHVENTAEWIEFGDGDSGTGSGTFSINYPENSNTTPRTTILKLVAENGRLLRSTIDIEVRQLKNQVVGLEQEKNQYPSVFELSQNYPNPFNPNTNIKYQIPFVETPYMASLQHVTLRIFDLLGREISTLVDEYKSPGSYEVEFDGSNLPSGIYFCKMFAGDFTQTIKLVLMK